MKNTLLNVDYYIVHKALSLELIRFEITYHVQYSDSLGTFFSSYIYLSYRIFFVENDFFYFIL